MRGFKRVVWSLAFVTAIAPVWLSADNRAVLSIKNYRQLYSAMSSVTGVPKTNTVVLNYFNQAYRRLSETGSVGNISGPLLLTTTILASRFCGQFINAEANLQPDKRKAHKMVDFTKTQSGLTTEVMTDVVNSYGELFWGRTPDATERQMGITLVQETIDQQAQSLDMTRKALLAACTNYLGGLEFIKQ